MTSRGHPAKRTIEALGTIGPMEPCRWVLAVLLSDGRGCETQCASSPTIGSFWVGLDGWREAAGDLVWLWLGAGLLSARR